jgi:hephaestin
MTPDAAGTWLFHCHVNDHLIAGMLGRYQVTT